MRAAERSSAIHSPVGVPVNGTPTTTWRTEPSFANVTVASATPHFLPRRHDRTLPEVPSSARLAAYALKSRVGAGDGAGAGGSGWAGGGRGAGRDTEATGVGAGPGPPQCRQSDATTATTNTAPIRDPTTMRTL